MQYQFITKHGVWNAQETPDTALPLEAVREILTQTVGATYEDYGKGFNVMLLGNLSGFEDFAAKYKLEPVFSEEWTSEVFLNNIRTLYNEIFSRKSSDGFKHLPWLLVLNDLNATPEVAAYIEKLRSPEAAELGCFVVEVTP